MPGPNVSQGFCPGWSRPTLPDKADQSIEKASKESCQKPGRSSSPTPGTSTGTSGKPSTFLKNIIKEWIIPARQ